MTDPTVIANSFNDFFSSNVTISDEPDKVDTWCEGHQGAPYLTGIQTNSNEVLKIIKSLKNGKAPGPDGITSTMLKHTAAQVAFPLALILISPLMKVKSLMIRRELMSSQFISLVTLGA